MPTLLLRISLAPSSATAPECDYVLSHDGQRIALQGRSALALLPMQKTRDTEVVAVLPASALSWHKVALPQRVAASVLSSRSEPARVRAVLSGAMEDVLLDEPEQLHFAVFAHSASADADQRYVRVAVCQRAALQSALQALETAGYAADRIVAECPPLADTTPGCAVWVTRSDDEDASPARMLLRTEHSVVALPLDASTAALAQSLHQAMASPTAAHDATALSSSPPPSPPPPAIPSSPLDLQAEPAVLALAEQAFGQAVQAVSPAQRLLHAAHSTLNLAQLDFSASRQGRWRKNLLRAWQTLLQAPPWRPVRWGLCALVLVHLVALNALAYKEQSLLREQRNALRSMLLESFPHIPLVVDAPAQMRREVALLAQSRGVVAQADVAQVLMVLGATPLEGATVTTIDLSNDEVRLQATGLNASTTERLRSALAQRGFSVRIAGNQITVQTQPPRRQGDV